jgi:hypothetical protein
MCAYSLDHITPKELTFPWSHKLYIENAGNVPGTTTMLTHVDRAIL